MDINKRVIKLQEYLGLSKSAFAEQISVSMPTITHIVSERNKVSLEVVQKILMRYQNINADWLVLGKGSMIREESTGDIEIMKGVLNEIMNKRLESKVIDDYIDQNLTVLKNRLYK